MFHFVLGYFGVKKIYIQLLETMDWYSCLVWVQSETLIEIYLHLLLYTFAMKTSLFSSPFWNAAVYPRHHSHLNHAGSFGHYSADDDAYHRMNQTTNQNQNPTMNRMENAFDYCVCDVSFVSSFVELSR